MIALPPPDIMPGDADFRKTPSNDRIGFVRKVLGIVSFQLLFTSVFSAVVIASDTLTETVQNSLGLAIFALIVSLFISIALICSNKLSRTLPYNYLALLLFVKII
jgi:FtsH-binding integral membrane protein